MMVVLRFLFVVPLGFVAACFTSAFALLWPYLSTGTGGGFADPIVLIHSAISFWAQSAQIGSTLLMPWAIFMVVTEVLRLSSAILHMAAGVAGAVVIMIAAYGADRPDTGIQAAIVIAGLVFALTYWVIAGRGAGNWRRPRRRVAPPLPPHAGTELELKPEPTAIRDRTNG